MSVVVKEHPRPTQNRAAQSPKQKDTLSRRESWGRRYEKLKRATLYLAVVVGFGGLGSAVASFIYLNIYTWEVSSVRVEGDFQYLKPSQTIERLEGLLVGRYYGWNLDPVQEMVEAQPWVHTARIRRVPPGQLMVEMKEQRPAARWNEDQILGRSGQVFQPERAASFDLVNLFGPQGSEIRVYNQYVLLKEQLAPHALFLSRVTFDPTTGWELELDTGMVVILGRDELRGRVDRFLEIFEGKLRIPNEEMQKINTVDMRYRNGGVLKN